MQYKEAFETLYQSDKPVDTIALPMMFLMRHYLELILKYNIKYFSEYSDLDFMVSKIKSEHKLKELASGFKQHWNTVVSKYTIEIDDSQYIINFDNFIDLMDTIDRYSMSFRYSHDKNNDKHFGHTETLDIYAIKKELDETVPLLDYSSDVFYDKVGQYLEMEKEMMIELENEIMRDMYGEYY
jgi:hypothetical protein